MPKSVQLLSQFGEITKISSVWESEPVGTEGDNYLNVCILFKATYEQAELKEQVLLPIETQLGRRRSDDKFAPRTIDIDTILFDDESVKNNFWELAFVIVPLAEIYPDYQNQQTRETVREAATRLRREVWLETRRGILS